MEENNATLKSRTATCCRNAHNQKIAVIALIALGMGAISCLTEPEIKYVEKEVIVTKYVCPKDKKQYDTAEEAANC